MKKFPNTDRILNLTHFDDSVWSYVSAEDYGCEKLRSFTPVIFLYALGVIVRKNKEETPHKNFNKEGNRSIGWIFWEYVIILEFKLLEAKWDWLYYACSNFPSLIELSLSNLNQSRMSALSLLFSFALHFSWVYPPLFWISYLTDTKRYNYKKNIAKCTLP